MVLAAGSDDAVAAARPVTDAIGAKVVRAGTTRRRLPAQAVCNAWVGSINAALGQSIALADGLGLDPQLFLDAVEGGAVDAPYVHLKGAAMIGSDWSTSFAVDGVVKDVGLIRAAAVETGTDPGCSTPCSPSRAASAGGHGDATWRGAHGV